MEGGQLEQPKPRRRPLAIFAVALAGVLISGWLLQRSMREAAHARGAAELDAVASLKAAAISSWRSDLEQDAVFAASYPFLTPLAARAAAAVDPEEVQRGREGLTSFAQRRRLVRAALLAPDGAPLLDHARREGPRPVDQALVDRVLASGGADSVLRAERGAASPALDVAAAVKDRDGRPRLVLYLWADAGPFLLALMGSWPVPSATAESVVVRRDGDAALFVSQPRFLPDWALRVRIPLTETSRGAARAVQQEGTFEAVDYRGTPTLNASRAVPRSDWFVVTRVDQAEVEAPLLRPATAIAALLFAILVASGLALLAWWRRELLQHRALSGARAQLEQSQERFRLALAGTHWVWDWDLRQQELSVDPEWAQRVRLPRSSARGSVEQILAGVVHPSQLEEVRRRFTAHQEGTTGLFEAEFLARLPVGPRWVLMRGRASLRDEAGRAWRVTGVLSDVTERHELQVQLARSDRMASLGALAAGVGHEVNNPLSYILDNLELLAAELPKAAPGRPDLAEAVAQTIDGAVRVRDVVRSLRAFSRPGAARAQVDVGEELAAALRLAGNELRHRARLEVQTGPLPAVAAGDHELGQVFLNLLVNAAQAIPEGSAQDHVVRVEADTDAAGWARVQIRDSGSGIPAQVLPHIFEPFFTTKPKGTGTGLGLAIAHEAVTAAGGRIEVESTVGKGTTFRVLLPPAEVGEGEGVGGDAGAEASAAATATAAAAALAPAPAAAPAAAPANGASRVLVIDDDPLVARSVARALKAAHEVVVVSSGQEALERLRGRERFDAFVCDLMMPEMTGMELQERAGALDPALAGRFVFVTGGAFTDRTRTFLEQTKNPWVEKPFAPERLREAVAQVLGGAPHP